MLKLLVLKNQDQETLNEERRKAETEKDITVTQIVYLMSDILSSTREIRLYLDAKDSPLPMRTITQIRVALDEMESAASVLHRSLTTGIGDSK